MSGSKDHLDVINSSDQLSLQLSVLARLRGETQASLSKKCGLSRATINRYFNGKTELRAKDLINLLSALGGEVMSEVSLEIESAYGGCGEQTREQVYSDVVSILRNLDQSVRKTIFEQVVWWASMAKENRAARATKESAKRVTNYLIQVVN